MAAWKSRARALTDGSQVSVHTGIIVGHFVLSLMTTWHSISISLACSTAIITIQGEAHGQMQRINSEPCFTVTFGAKQAAVSAGPAH